MLLARTRTFFNEHFIAGASVLILSDAPVPPTTIFEKEVIQELLTSLSGEVTVAACIKANYINSRGHRVSVLPLYFSSSSNQTRQTLKHFFTSPDLRNTVFFKKQSKDSFGATSSRGSNENKTLSYLLCSSHA